MMRSGKVGKGNGIHGERAGLGLVQLVLIATPVRDDGDPLR